MAIITTQGTVSGGTWAPTGVSDFSNDVLIMLNTLFVDHVVIYHDLLCKRKKLLSAGEASKYIENCFPNSWLIVGQPLYKTISSSRLLTWYEAKDTTSYVEIRFPRNKKEWNSAIKGIQGSYSALSYASNMYITVAPYSHSGTAITYTNVPANTSYTISVPSTTTIPGPVSIYAQTAANTQ